MKLEAHFSSLSVVSGAWNTLIRDPLLSNFFCSVLAHGESGCLSLYLVTECLTFHMVTEDVFSLTEDILSLFLYPILSYTVQHINLYRDACGHAGIGQMELDYSFQVLEEKSFKQKIEILRPIQERTAWQECV